jgi:hypothetical protein
MAGLRSSRKGANEVSKSQFAALRGAAGRKTTIEADTPPPRATGRPKSTSADSAPVTFHVSEESVRKAKIKLLQDNDKRPLSKIVDLLLEEWSAGKVRI